MNTLKYFFLFLSIVTTLLFYSCKKESLDFSQSLNLDNRTDDPNEEISRIGNPEDTIPSITTLGNVRVNPYTVQVMTQAWNNLYPNMQRASLNPTHLYVKFSPQNPQDLNLLDQTGLMLFDFPLDREVIEMGDYYIQPGKENPASIPDLWAVVSTDFASPISGYQIISSLVIIPMNTLLVKEAFRITGNPYDIGDNPEYIKDDNCCPECPNYPECLINVTIPCGGEVNCPHGDPGGGNGGGNPDPHPDEVQFCNCWVYKEQRKPGGCVRVQDVEHQQFEGVEDVKVVIWDGWFGVWDTQTDVNGCWKINNKQYGRTWMWVRWKSDITRIRGARQGFWRFFYDWQFTMTHYVGALRGPKVNNIRVEYPIWTDRGSAAHLHWGASTVNNALHDFHRYAATLGINAPPWLDINVARNRGDGIALMNTYLGNGNIIAAIGNSGFFQDALHDLIHLPPSSGLFLPDVQIGINFRHSDFLKLLSYHEIAHASHYTKAGDNFYLNLIRQEAHNGSVPPFDTYVDYGGIHQGHITLAESWADHVGYTFTHMTYPGDNNSFRGADWEENLERLRFNAPNNLIPIGIYHDMKDGVNPNELAFDECVCGEGPINDQISGFNEAQMFQLLDGTTVSPNHFLVKFITNHGNGNQDLINKFQILYDSYQ
ncbi:MAG: hypothetical protein IT265_02760 [Saprospiraceae bacterium]|nr:hypothetical protein [Saprospiraceae bacterium]